MCVITCEDLVNGRRKEGEMCSHSQDPRQAAEGSSPGSLCSARLDRVCFHMHSELEEESQLGCPYHIEGILFKLMLSHKALHRRKLSINISRRSRENIYKIRGTTAIERRRRYCIKVALPRGPEG